MVRKVTMYVCVLALIFGLAVTAQAATHSVYNEGNISSTYVTYFKDILSGVPFTDNYVAFRSGQYSYLMVTGDIDFNEQTKTFTLNGEGRQYLFSTSNSGYNSYYTYNNATISNFSLDVDNEILYSDLGHYPELMERGAKYEILTTLLVCIALLAYVVGRFFRVR